jgi:hypothetical protein
MRLLLVSAVPLFLQAAAGAVIQRDNSQPAICASLRVKGGGCIRCNFTYQLPEVFA